MASVLIMTAPSGAQMVSRAKAIIMTARDLVGRVSTAVDDLIVKVGILRVLTDDLMRIGVRSDIGLSLIPDARIAVAFRGTRTLEIQGDDRIIAAIHSFLDPLHELGHFVQTPFSWVDVPRSLVPRIVARVSGCDESASLTCTAARIIALASPQPAFRDLVAACKVAAQLSTPEDAIRVAFFSLTDGAWSDRLDHRSVFITTPDSDFLRIHVRHATDAANIRSILAAVSS